jgi:hypothetical protein
VTFVLYALLALSPFQAPTAAPPSKANLSLLAPGATVFVEPARDDGHTIMSEKLEKWGRWRVVQTPADADLTVRLILSGSAGWGRGSMTATIYDARTDTLLWTSRQQTGNRTVFHGYASPYKRAADGLIKQMEKASSSWPSQRAEVAK